MILRHYIHLLAWTIVIAAAVLCLASIAIAVCILLSPSSDTDLAKIQQQLHDTYYVVVYPNQSAWIFLVSAILAAGLGLFAYHHTAPSPNTPSFIKTTSQ
jgi:hypothetical protein